ncbi:hypothetical protein BIW11_09717 [Tropilaelaps mercedesae]|uniref:Uncharacterized protein n=1 Tax=Tropilaelaps mercedesae TaxID=418985 RepID=A0A1V9XIZ2_9ACAR|nr:hypothetical protein BIW11_09717 [Tropilaelaps mercedesae]
MAARRTGKSISGVSLPRRIPSRSSCS